MDMGSKYTFSCESIQLGRVTGTVLFFYAIWQIPDPHGAP